MPQKESIGCVFDIKKRSALIRIWGPHVDSAVVRITYNGCINNNDDESFDMVKIGNDIWECNIENIKDVSGDIKAPGYYFCVKSNWNDCFHQEGEILVRRDPDARAAEFSSNLCYMDDYQNFDWTGDTPPNIPHHLLNVYELHVGSFSGKEDNLPPPETGKALTNASVHLSHIKQLNFNAVELMPLQEFGGLWGYNPRLLSCIHGKWGQPDDLRSFVREAHKQGIAVILDVVLNHGSSKLNSLWNWDGFAGHGGGGIYFQGGEDTPWGRKFSFHSHEVSEYIKRSARIWLEEYRLDGLRFDSVHNMPWDLLKDMTQNLRKEFPGKVLIAEVTPEDPKTCRPVEHGGCGFDSVWVHSAYYDSLRLARGELDSHQHINVIKAILDLPPAFGKSSQVTNSVLGSHDQAGNRQGGKHDGKHHRLITHTHTYTHTHGPKTHTYRTHTHTHNTHAHTHTVHTHKHTVDMHIHAIYTSCTHTHTHTHSKTHAVPKHNIHTHRTYTHTIPTFQNRK
eukprot:GHVR01028702.1.p1 GENE.GHVR01028702.1~~GHVR01028702.1.p1  ORF type:complete len:508 (-),score=152.88 GHVR01028702.1:206-1729(-)